MILNIITWLVIRQNIYGNADLIIELSNDTDYYKYFKLEAKYQNNDNKEL
jgi:hypothetical protein